MTQSPTEISAMNHGAATTDHARYLEFMNGFMRGEAPSEQQFLDHFEHQNGHPANMLAIGHEAPDLGLVDQHGRRRSLADLMGTRGLIVVFVRSTYWCPYCRNQLAELNMRLNETRRAGYGVVAITSDEAERIRDFADHHQIDYPILADPEATAIDAYGVRNTRIPPNDLQGHRPLPHPGLFLIGADRVIAAREFTGDIRHRVSASAVVEELATETETPAHAVRASTDQLAVAAWLSATEVLGGQEIALTVRARPAEGVHVYGSDVEAPYVGLNVTVTSTNELIDQYRITPPKGVALELPALGEVLPALERDFTVSGRIRLRWSPTRSHFDELADLVASNAIAPGDYVLKVAVRYQACDGNECFMPTKLTFDLPLTVGANAAAGSAVRLGATEIPPPGQEDGNP